MGVDLGAACLQSSSEVVSGPSTQSAILALRFSLAWAEREPDAYDTDECVKRERYISMDNRDGKRKRESGVHRRGLGVVPRVDLMPMYILLLYSRKAGEGHQSRDATRLEQDYRRPVPRTYVCTYSMYCNSTRRRGVTSIGPNEASSSEYKDGRVPHGMPRFRPSGGLPYLARRNPRCRRSGVSGRPPLFQTGPDCHVCDFCYIRSTE